MQPSRRRFVATVGAALGTGLAGCTGGGSEGTGGGNASDGANAANATNGTGGGNASGATGGSGNASSVGDVTGTVRKQTSDKLKLVRHEFYETDAGRGVRGTIKNVSDQRIVYGEVKVTPIDSDATGEGKYYADTRSANVDSLKPGETWQFDVQFRETNEIQNLRRYEIWTTAQTKAQTSG